MTELERFVGLRREKNVEEKILKTLEQKYRAG